MGSHRLLFDIGGREVSKFNAYFKSRIYRLKDASIQSLKEFALHFFIGWAVMLTLLFGLAYRTEMLVIDITFWFEIAFSIISLALPLLVGSICSMLKFNSVYFK